MSDAHAGQVTSTAAEIYDQFFVPALFAEWAPRLCDAALIGEGQAVLDVGCGTGVATRAATQRVGPTGAVTGVDINDGMLAVARGNDPDTTWQRAPAEKLPFEDDAFDAVVSQFALMFFDDPQQAIAEMNRVAKPGGQLAIAVWCSLSETPGYTAMAGLLGRLFGEEAAEALRVPYTMGDPSELESLLRTAGLDATATTRPGTAVFPSIESWVHTDIRGWTLADMIDDEQFERLQLAAQDELQPFVRTDGTVAFEHPAIIVTATAR